MFAALGGFAKAYATAYASTNALVAWEPGVGLHQHPFDVGGAYWRRHAEGLRTKAFEPRPDPSCHRWLTLVLDGSTCSKLASSSVHVVSAYAEVVRVGALRPL